MEGWRKTQDSGTAQRGRGLTHSAQTGPGQTLKRQAQAKGGSPLWKRNLGHQTSLYPPPQKGPLQPCQHLHAAHSGLSGRRTLEKKDPLLRRVWRKGLNSPLVWRKEKLPSPSRRGGGRLVRSNCCCGRSASRDARRHPALRRPAPPGQRRRARGTAGYPRARPGWSLHNAQGFNLTGGGGGVAPGTLFKCRFELFTRGQTAALPRPQQRPAPGATQPHTFTVFPWPVEGIRYLPP